jgi:hypothetical protein
MPVGLYRVELWDVFSGNVVGSEEVTVSGAVDGELRIALLPVARMLAVRAVRIAEPGNLPTVTPSPTATPRLAPSATPSPTPSATPSATPTELPTATPTIRVVG